MLEARYLRTACLVVCSQTWSMCPAVTHPLQLLWKSRCLLRLSLVLSAAKKAVVQRSAEELFGEGPAAGGGGEGGCCSGYLHGALRKWLAL
jgi:hypothetical protein